MSVRRQNLELMKAYGANKWRIGNFLAEKDIERAKAELEAVRERTEEVNRSRKSSQVRFARLDCPATVDLRMSHSFR